MWKAFITILSLPAWYMLTSFHSYKKMAQDRIVSITRNAVYSPQISWHVNLEKVLKMFDYSPFSHLMWLLA
jgi:hypothetical protein